MKRCKATACQSCGVQVIEELNEVISSYSQVDRDTEYREELREELILIVERHNKLSRDMLKQKTLGEEIIECDQERDKIWGKLK